MNKKTLAIILSIALAIGAFAGLSFNLFSANAVEYVGDGTNVAYNATGANTSNASVFEKSILTNYVEGTTEKKGANIAGIRVTGAGQDGDGYYARANTSTFTWSGSGNAWRDVTPFYLEYGNKIEAGDKYVVSTYVRLAEEATDVKAYFATADLSGRLYASSRSQKSEDVAISTQWTKVEWVIENASATADKFLGLVVSKAVAVDFDAISVQKAVAAATPEPTPTATPEPVFVGDGTELINNGNAPTATTGSIYHVNGTGWRKLTTYASSGTATTAVDIGSFTKQGTDNDGNGYYLAIPVREHSNGWRNQTHFNCAFMSSASVATAFELNQKYVISVAVKLPEASQATQEAYLATAEYTMRLSNADRKQKSDSITLTTEWQTLTWVMAPTDAKEYYLGLVTTNAIAIDVDSISIQKAVDASTLVTPVPTEVATPTTTATATPTATPEPTPEYVGDGKEYVNNGNCYAEMNLKASGIGLSGGVTKTIVEAADHGGNNKYYKLTPRTDGTVPGSRFHFNDTANMVNDGGAGMYIASVWVRIPDATTPVKLGFGFGEGFAFGTRPTFEVGSEWTQMVHIMELKDTTAHPKYIIGIFELGETKTLDIHIDDFSVQKAVIKTVGPTPEPTPLPTGNGVEYVINGDLSGEMSLNEETLFVAGGATRIIIPGEDHGGNNRMLKITPRTDGVFGSRLHFNSTNKMVADGGAGQYIASVWVKIPDATEPVNIGFGFGETFVSSRPTFKVGNEWTQLVHVMELKDVSEIEKYILGIFEVGSTTELDIYVDDFSVQKVGKPQGGSSAGGSNTGDVLPVALIAVAVISASALIVVARRKREE